MCLSHCSVTVKRHHDPKQLLEKKEFIGVLLTVSETESIIILAESMAAGKRGAESYILIHRQRERI